MPVREFFSAAEWAALPERRRAQFSTTLDVLYADVAERAACLPLIGFLHDMGKILLHPRFGGLPPWSVVVSSPGVFTLRSSYFAPGETNKKRAMRSVGKQVEIEN